MVTRTIIKLALIALFSFLGGAFSTWLTSGQVSAQNQIDTYADSVSARIFRLVDKHGKFKGAFGFEETGSPTLVFKDANEKNRFIITSHPSGPMLVFQDGKERMRVGMDLNESGEFSLTYFDEKKTHRASLLVNSTDGPKFSFMDDHGRVRLGMQLYQNSQPMLFLGNEQGKQEILLSLDKNFGPGLYLHDKAGRPLTAFTPQGQVILEQAGVIQKTTR